MLEARHLIVEFEDGKSKDIIVSNISTTSADQKLSDSELLSLAINSLEIDIDEVDKIYDVREA